jgi:RNA-directed DNA polymerase
MIRAGRKRGNSLTVHKVYFYKGVISMTTKTLKSYVDEWKTLPWKKFQKNLFRLQHRIYKAAKSEDKSSVKQLQSLLIGSKCSKYLAIRQVTQLNSGKKTGGIDGVSSLNPKQRFILAQELDSMHRWKHQKLRRVFIPKNNGEMRSLGLARIRDRAMQCLIKYALEPVYEAMASDGSYGVHPGHSTWDVQGRIYQNLKANSLGYTKRILEVDIKECVDNIDHSKWMSLITLPRVAMKFLWSALKAGVLRERETTKMGTPQEGLIHPLLWNIASHGVEDLHNKWAYRSRWHQRGLRYADNIIFILNEGECWQKLFNNVNDFLKSRGLKPQKAKIRLVTSQEGFDFLGWHFKVKSGNNKYVCYPSKDSVQNLKNRIKQVLKDSRYKLINRVEMLKTIYRSWWNYHQYCDMSQVNSVLWSIRQWSYKYITKNSNISGKKAAELTGLIYNRHSYKVNRSTSIKESKSVYDNDVVSWSERIIPDHY